MRALWKEQIQGFVNRMLTSLQPKKIRSGWKKLHNGDVYNFYYTIRGTNIKDTEMGGTRKYIAGNLAGIAEDITWETQEMMGG